MPAYYNENEPFAADWLEELCRRGGITEGRVDRRSVVEVRADDVRDARRAHFFAGIAAWDYALKLAGWPVDSDLVVWTGSAPCQPFSQASPDARGFTDERHLWPEWFRLIAECRPHVVCGEQVASPAGLAWLDVVLADLEGADYACWAVDLCAASVGAPHRRQRLFFVAVRNDVADASDARSQGRAWPGRDAGAAAPRHGAVGGVADDDAAGRVVVGRGRVQDERDAPRRHDAHGRGAASVAGRVGNAGDDRDREHDRELPSDEGEHALGASHGDHTPGDAGATRDPRDLWRDCDWVWCTDGRWRPVEPGPVEMADGSTPGVGRGGGGDCAYPTHPLVHGAINRAARLRAYGNAIVPQVAAVFIRAACEAAGLPLVDAGP